MAEKLTLSDRLIDAWHEDIHCGLTLHEYLGLSWEEYAAVCLDPDALDEAVSNAKSLQNAKEEQ